MQRWLWVTLPETWAYQDLALRTLAVWSCDKDTRRGDVALLYRAEAAQDFSHLFKARSDAYEDEDLAAEWDLDWWCRAEVVCELRQPISLGAVRQEPRLSAWIAAQLNFHGSAFPIEPPEWRALLALASPVDRPCLRSAGGS
jgi:predicted RNA-binding protein with PUA-like domain